MKERLLAAYEQAKINMDKMNAKNKARYDNSAHATELEVGDRVLVRKLGPRLDSKLSDKWEREVYRVVARKEGIPVYTVRDEMNNGPNRTLHRNYLPPTGMLDAQNPSEQACRRGKIDLPIPSRDTKIKDVPAPNQDSVESTDHVGLTVEISQAPLRPDAPVFIPNSPHPVDNVNVPPSDETPAEGVVKLGQGEGDQDITPGRSRDEFESEPVRDHQDPIPCEDMSDDSDSLSSVEEFSSSEGTSEEKLSEHSGPRRSSRKRKPVERLNLLHTVKTGPELSNIKARIDMLSKHLKDMPSEYVLFEMNNILKDFSSLCK
jgi:hypothetical protein